MSSTSSVLGLPYIQQNQAQKHITHNEALRVLDKITQLVVQDRFASAPPANPVQGETYIVGPTPTGDWVGHEDAIATFEDAAWVFVVPKPGWRAHVLAHNAQVVFEDGAGWQTPDLGQFDKVGVNTSADTTNRLAVASDASLFTHVGEDHQLKVNKAASADTASLMFQTGFSGRAEMGTIGSDDFGIKVSADGADWASVLQANATTGHVTFPSDVTLDGAVAGQSVQNGFHDTTVGKLLKVGAFGWGVLNNNLPTTPLNQALSSGVHKFSAVDSDKPIASGGAVLVIRYAHLWVNQIAFAPTANEMWLRYTKNNGAVWSDWVPLTPFGRTNANGRYTRFTDGSMTCQTQRQSSNAGPATWVFPSGFGSTNTSVHVSAVHSAPAIAVVDTIGLTSCDFSVYDLNGARITADVTITATGEW